MWTSLILPSLGSFAVCAISYYFGSCGFSYAWIVLLVAFNVAKSYLWKKRESRLMSLRSARHKEREVVMAQLADLPAWVHFPDTERVEWLNKVIQQLWPYISEYAKVFMADVIVPQVRAQMPAVFKSFKFTNMDMGDLGCRVGGIKVYTHNVGRDRIIVDMDVAYAGDADFSISCCGFSGGMNQIQFTGKLRAILKPLLPYPPMIGGVSGTFLEMPKVDFNLTGMGEMVELPGLMNAIRSVVNSQIAAMCVLPNEIVVPLAPNVDITQLFFPEPDGVIRLKIIEARNLENRDISFIRKGKSDPYAEIQIGSQFLKTRTIDNDLNPVWNESFEAVVDQANGQHLRIECFDEDNGQDEELGRLTVPLSHIREKGDIDEWYPLEGCKHGDLHIRSCWMTLSSDKATLEKTDWDNDWIHADKPIHSSLLMVFVDNISDLPYPKARLEPSPFVEVSLGKDVKRTPTKPKTINPLFQNKFSFFVKHPAGQELKIEAIDEGTRRSLGSLTIPLLQLMKEPNMELYQTTHMLSLGVQQAPIVLTLRLRGLVARPRGRIDPKDIADETLARYANASHIERAEKEESDSKESIHGGSHSGSQLSINTKGKNAFGRLISITGKKERNGSSLRDRGELEIGIRHIDDHLEVCVQRAKNLRGRDAPPSPYVQVQLITSENNKVVDKRKTAAIPHTTQPLFENRFSFPIAKADLVNYSLQFKVKDNANAGIMNKKAVIGQIDLRLESLPDGNIPMRWFVLEGERK